MDISELLERFERGQVAAAARLITIIENGGKEAEEVMDGIFPKTMGTYRIGFTGPPGAGKSSLVYHLSEHFREQDKSIGIIVVDPTSPFSGGALLGDRIRMQKLSEDPEVFVRSLASRGSLGGISNCTDEVADLLDAFGKDLILIETVGVGQSELEVAEKSHTVVVILVPESGDGIQAMKAGLMEIGDIFVMNKADHRDAELAAKTIEDSLMLREVHEGLWKPPVVLTSALQSTGIEELAGRIEEHHRFLEEKGLLEEKRRQILRSRVRNAFMDKMERKICDSSSVCKILEERMEEIYSARLSPYQVVRELEALVKIE
ncbi:MAG: methylmalonyl Co-A mutase-associated GTPase MeaB [Candidatus Krumholzibacteria bacterium]|nr:methylmalonyl Co-A mutase-associated GTPase MeaB [Candidatus Krumholzibacteria bacterium]